MLDRRPRQVEAGIADEEAVIGFRHPRRRHHRVASAIRAAEHVGIIGLAAVMRGDDRLGDRRERHVGRIAVVAPGLRIEAEGRARGEAERLVGRIDAGMSAVRRHDRKAARERRHAAGSERLRLVAGRRQHRPVVAAVGLIEKPPVPFDRKPHLESDRVALAVGAGSIVDLAGQDAMFRQAVARLLHLRAVDDETGNRERLGRDLRAALVLSERRAVGGEAEQQTGGGRQRQRTMESSGHGELALLAVAAVRSGYRPGSALSAAAPCCAGFRRTRGDSTNRADPRAR